MLGASLSLLALALPALAGDLLPFSDLRPMSKGAQEARDHLSPNLTLGVDPYDLADFILDGFILEGIPLSKRQYRCNNPSYEPCPDYSGCKPPGAQCCGGGKYCAVGNYCLQGGGCCPNGKTCYGGKYCETDGYVPCGGGLDWCGPVGGQCCRKVNRMTCDNGYYCSTMTNGDVCCCPDGKVCYGPRCYRCLIDGDVPCGTYGNYDGCRPGDATCCTNGKYCDAGTYCTTTGCCPNGQVCYSGGGGGGGGGAVEYTTRYTSWTNTYTYTTYGDAGQTTTSTKAPTTPTTIAPTRPTDTELPLPDDLPFDTTTSGLGVATSATLSSMPILGLPSSSGGVASVAAVAGNLPASSGFVFALTPRQSVWLGVCGVIVALVV